MSTPEQSQSLLSRQRPDGSVEAAEPHADVLVYEELLNRDPRWALSEGSRHFEQESAVFKALYNMTQRLKELGIPYAVVGGMALFRQGVRRFTEDVDLLVTKDDLERIHQSLEGLGYLPPVRNSKNLRDTQLGVRIKFLTTGDYPGDGKKKPVAFPDPRMVTFEAEGIAYVTLETLVELKLASGMTNPGRLRDLSDVLELIKALRLPAEFADRLNPYVQGKFLELWQVAEEFGADEMSERWDPPSGSTDDLPDTGAAEE